MKWLLDLWSNKGRTFSLRLNGESVSVYEGITRQYDFESLEDTLGIAISAGAMLAHIEKTRGAQIIFRDGDGTEWLYSLKEPGTATRIQAGTPPPSGSKPKVRGEGNVLHFDFGKKK